MKIPQITAILLVVSMLAAACGKNTAPLSPKAIQPEAVSTPTSSEVPAP